MEEGCAENGSKLFVRRILCGLSVLGFGVRAEALDRQQPLPCGSACACSLRRPAALPRHKLDRSFPDPRTADHSFIQKKKPFCVFAKRFWSGLRGSNSLPPPWQGGALPDELNPHLWCFRSESNQRHEDFQSSALPTELQRHHLATRMGLEPMTSSVTG